ncbi:unnamed protein product [Nyctereutes procyonoides]|uniref:(raccoon dog) hypothetical protein n=1 Tax=Nyctereutes procyonoides TaxID=34880 RepID=A0A811YNA0_NYCPR|nr:unnamed protein product [Nyctereutes procyonoides]
MSFCSSFGGEVFQNHIEPAAQSMHVWLAFNETTHAHSVAKHQKHNIPEALKELLPLRSHRAGISYPFQLKTMPCGHTNDPTLELEAQTLRQGRGLA